MRRAIFLLLLFLWAAPASAQSLPDNIAELRQHSLELVNRSRAEHGLPALKLSDPLNEAAQRHAADMLERNYFAHKSPDGKTVLDRFRKAGGPKGRVVRENIAECEGCRGPIGMDEVERLHSGWMHSPEHRANILAEGLARYGFGVAQRGGKRYGVETFSGPGVPRETSGNGKSIDAPAQTELAVSLINELRGNSSLAASPELARHIASRLPEKGLLNVDPKKLGLLKGLPSGLSARRFQVLFGQCGGCGTRPTAADVRFFVDNWRKHQAYRRVLADGSFGRLGLAIAADSNGTKLAVAILAGS